MHVIRVGIAVIACAASAVCGCASRHGSQPGAPRAASPAPGHPRSPGAPAQEHPSVEPPGLRLDPAVRPLQYRVALDLDPARDHFDGEITIALELAEAREHIWLHATELDVRSASLSAGGESWALSLLPERDPDVIGFALGRTLEPGQATLRIAYRGRIVAGEDSGVFKRRDRDRWYVYTQFEPLSARRAFPCFDEPGFKVPWQLTIHAPEDHMALANSPVTEESAGPRPGTRTHRFAPTEPLPSYLIAFAVGPFEAVDLGRIGRGDTPARVVVPRGRTAEARYAAEITPRLLALLEDYFDMAYPYAKLDSIAIPHFPGAMEHPGLVTYAQRRLLSPPAQETASFRRRYAGLALHELAHQWFGNLVTMAWWDDLWLNESFATWLAGKLLRRVEPAWDAEIHAVTRADGTMAADSLTTARRMRQPIASRHDIAIAFDDIVYGKGRAVLAMFERWIGAERFRAGVRAHLRAHAGGNATTRDFLATLSEASRPEVAAAFRTFLDQAGVPVISADLVCEPGARPALELAQERFLPMGSAGSTTDRLWHVPVCVKYGQARGRVREQCLLLTGETDTMVLKRARRCPDWVLANAGAAGYYRAAYAPEAQTALLGRARRHLSVPERVRLAADLQSLVIAGKMEMGEALALAPALLRDPSDHVARVAVKLVAGVRSHLVPASLADHYARFVRKTFGARARKLGWRPRPGEPEATRLLRPALVGLVAMQGRDPALIAQAKRLAATWLEQRAGIAPDLLAPVLATASMHGDAAFHDRLEQAIAATGDLRQRSALIGALAQARDPARVRANLELYLTDQLDVREAGALLFVPLGVPRTRGLVYRFIKEHYDALAARLPRRGLVFLILAASSLCDQAHLDDVQAFFGARVESIPGGPVALAQTRERIQLCMVTRAFQQPSVERFLKTQ